MWLFLNVSCKCRIQYIKTPKIRRVVIHYSSIELDQEDPWKFEINEDVRKQKEEVNRSIWDLGIGFAMFKIILIWECLFSKDLIYRDYLQK